MPASVFASDPPFRRSIRMFVSNSAFTSDHPITLAISAGIRLHRRHDLSRRRTPGGCENLISGAPVLGETSLLPAGLSPPGRCRVFCRKRPAPESVLWESPRSFARRYRLWIKRSGSIRFWTLKGQSVLRMPATPPLPVLPVVKNLFSCLELWELYQAQRQLIVRPSAS